MIPAIRRIALAAIAAAFAAGAAHADLLTITVPVDVKSLMKNITSVSVGCIIYAQNGKELGAGWSDPKTPDDQGNLKGNLSVPVKTEHEGDLPKAVTYKCGLGLISPANPQLYFDYVNGHMDPGYEGTPKPGAPFTPNTTGPLPKFQ